jgi:hypothetical protein
MNERIVKSSESVGAGAVRNDGDGAGFASVHALRINARAAAAPAKMLIVDRMTPPWLVADSERAAAAPSPAKVHPAP